jgi:ATP phosphoribosyltransferase regulatory subunit
MGLNNWKRYIPDGTRDLIFDECTRKNNIVNTLRDFYLRCGFLEAATPTLEFYDVFHLGNLSINQERMYKLFDSTGRILVLRPDMTTPIARLAATKLSKEILPVRICYSGNVFRMNESWEGKFSEITQTGIEILGVEDQAADSEVVITAIKALLSIGLTDFEIELGQAGFFKALLEDICLEEEETERLRSLVENKNFTSLREFIEENQYRLGESSDALKSLPVLFGGIEVLDKARKLTSNKNALIAIKNIEDIYKNIKTIGLAKYVSIDLGMVQRINYYTGITFRGYSSRLAKTILSGGRYDNLISKFGQDMQATGFGINVDSIMAALESEDKLQTLKVKYLIRFKNDFIGQAYAIADQLRSRGLQAEISLLKEKEDCIVYSKTKGIDKLISITDEDLIDILDIKAGDTEVVGIMDYIKG